MATDTTNLDVSPILKLIPEKIRSEIVMICTVIAVIGSQIGSYVVLNGQAAHVEAWVLSAAIFVLGLIQRGTVTPTHNVAVDKRDTTSPVNGTAFGLEPGEVPPELA